jgi:hypothetical protein
MEIRHWRATEHQAVGYVDNRVVRATLVVPDERSPLIQYIAKRMALVATPYWPCTDLKQPEDSDGT